VGLMVGLRSGLTSSFDLMLGGGTAVESSGARKEWQSRRELSYEPRFCKGMCIGRYGHRMGQGDGRMGILRCRKGQRVGDVVYV